jgi:hypothetical protein
VSYAGVKKERETDTNQYLLLKRERKGRRAKNKERIKRPPSLPQFYYFPSYKTAPQIASHYDALCHFSSLGCTTQGKLDFDGYA